jgi:hypothetical protein
VTEDELEDFFERCPRLYHMAMPGSWNLISQIGLLCTDKLLEAFGADGGVVEKLTQQRRPTSVEIISDSYGQAIIRDQIPLLDADLAACLRDGLSARDWHRLLNERVFLWTNTKRLSTLLNAQAYRNMSHDVLTLKTRELFDDYREKIELSPMNSGCTRPWRHPRGKDTFLAIQDYPYKDRLKRGRKDDAIVEVTVLEGIEPILPYVEKVRRMRRDEVEFEIFPG